MDSYIVHILRRSQSKSEKTSQLDGVVELVSENRQQRVFHSADELWQILSDISEMQDVDGD